MTNPKHLIERLRASLDGEWRSLSSLKLTSNTRHLIGPAQRLQREGVIESKFGPGQSYLVYRLVRP